MIKDWLDSMSPRERIMVIGCAAFVALALLWVLAIQPLAKQSAGLEERVSSKRAQLSNLHELASRVQPGNASGQSTAGSNDSLVVIIDRTTRAKQLAQYLKRNQPEDAFSVRLRFEGAPFDALVGWLGELNDRYAMTVSNANFDRTDAGRVNASLVIRRAGA